MTLLWNYGLEIPIGLQYIIAPFLLKKFIYFEYVCSKLSKYQDTYNAEVQQNKLCIVFLQGTPYIHKVYLMFYI